jgi:hypothetical protein
MGASLIRPETGLPGRLIRGSSASINSANELAFPPARINLE